MSNHDDSVVGFARAHPIKCHPPGQRRRGFIGQRHVQDAISVDVEFMGQVTEGRSLLGRPSKGCEEVRVKIRCRARVCWTPIDNGSHRSTPDSDATSLPISRMAAGAQHPPVAGQRRRVRRRGHCWAITRVLECTGSVGVRTLSGRAGWRPVSWWLFSHSLVCRDRRRPRTCPRRPARESNTLSLT